MDKVIFREDQKYKQWWMWVILLSAFGFAVVPVWYGLYIQLSTGKTWGDHPASNGALAGIAILTTVLMAAVIILFSTTQLQVEIRNDGVHFRYPPLVRRWKVITKDEIQRFEAGKYRPVIEYGGWGLKYGGRKYGRAYNVSGNLGLKLFLKNGKIILLGTQRIQAIAYAMDKMMSGKEPG